jgi:hypothetical protein
MMAIEKNLPIDDYLGIDALTDPQETATPKGRAADDYLGIGALGGQGNTPAAQTRSASDYLGLEALGGAGAGIASSFTGGIPTDPTGASGATGVTGATGPDGDTKLPSSEMQDAYQRLFDEFNALGLGALVADSKDLLMRATSIAAIPDALRGTKAYMTRFSANDARIKAGLTALSPADYLAKEDAYQKIMRDYGLPASYYKTGLYGKQEGFDALLSNDVSALELETRIATAQDRVLKANPEVTQALKKFYPDITDGDILAYTLDPKNAIKDIQRKVTAAEIGGAALQQTGLTTNLARAEELQRYGVDKAAATEGYSAIGGGLQRGSQLASIYGESPYTQATAESEIFKLTGQDEARKQRQKITGLEKATFGGQSGVTTGALARDRAGGY